jgi:hypothetical protein
VVTDDVVDRPPLKMSMRWGCQQLGLATSTALEFARWIGIV